jgi:uncharacterized protein with von Willebrand factor type A (vWA) domain
MNNIEGNTLEDPRLRSFKYLKKVTVIKDDIAVFYYTKDVWDNMNGNIILGDSCMSDWIIAYIPYGYLISIVEIENPNYKKSLCKFASV